MYILMIATLVAVYWFWIRPILKSRPAIQEFYEREDSLFVALTSTPLTMARRNRSSSETWLTSATRRNWQIRPKRAKEGSAMWTWLASLDRRARHQRPDQCVQGEA